MYIAYEIENLLFYAKFVKLPIFQLQTNLDFIFIILDFVEKKNLIIFFVSAYKNQSSKSKNSNATYITSQKVINNKIAVKKLTHRPW